MPQENRKRGRKHKKTREEPIETAPVEEYPEQDNGYQNEENSAGPSWLVQSTHKQESFEDADAPFGLVDVDVKAYFRTVDIQIRDWQENQNEQLSAGLPQDGSDPNSEKQMFFMAAMNEMNGKEKMLATDPECSIVLERMAYSMDDFVRRVFLDSLTGSWEVLVKHRFASHVCQTMLTVASDTLTREINGVLPSMPESAAGGELRSMSQLIQDICEELLPSMTSFLMHPFASHVLRTFLVLLSSSNMFDDSLRSKKSTAWKDKQGPMKSMFDTSSSTYKGKQKEGTPKRNIPPEFPTLTARCIGKILEENNDNELRAMAADKVASPALHVLLEVEASLDMHTKSYSLLDRISGGAITFSASNKTLDESEYIPSLMRDSTSSRLMESVFLNSPPGAFGLLWGTYLKGNMIKLANHPIANFVLSKAVEKAGEGQLKGMLEELDEVLDKWAQVSNVSASRIGVLKALVDRCAALGCLGEEILHAVYNVLHLNSADDRLLLVPCLLRLQAAEECKAAANTEYKAQVQGALILQSLLRLPEPHNIAVMESFLHQSLPARLRIAHDPTSSRVLDALLESPTLPGKAKRKFLLAWMGEYHQLVDDRIGSRVGDRCWDCADTYLKEKIARSLIQYESHLAGSRYGKYFARSLNLYLLQKRPEEWKDLQSAKSKKAAVPTTGAGLAATTAVENVPSSPLKETKNARPQKQSNETKKAKKRKREEDGPKDEIDEVFAHAFGKKTKKSALKAA